MKAHVRHEETYGEVDGVLLYIDDARWRAKAACAALRASGAEDFLLEALERTEEQLAEAGELLKQGTFFAVSKQRLTLT
jgi:hypothetical protein